MRNIENQLGNGGEGYIGVIDLGDIMKGFGIALPIAGLWMYLVYQGLDLLVKYSERNAGGCTYF